MAWLDLLALDRTESAISQLLVMIEQLIFLGVVLTKSTIF